MGASGSAIICQWLPSMNKFTELRMLQERRKLHQRKRTTDIDIGYHHVSVALYNNTCEKEQESLQTPKTLSLLDVFIQAFCYIYNLKQKFESAHSKVEDLSAKLEERDREVEEMGAVIDELKKTSLYHQKQIEYQENQIGEQQGILREIYVAFKMMEKGDGGQSQRLVGIATKLGSAPREYLVLRKHFRNLASVTRPFISVVIRSACKAGLVSPNIGLCAENCPEQDHHDCTAEFYKALQLTVSENPSAFAHFLRILKENVESASCQRLCRTIQTELNVFG